MHEAHYQAMQERREAMRARWESYRRTVEAMTEEQREAAAAIFGQHKPPVPPRPPVQPVWQNQGYAPMGHPMPNYQQPRMPAGYGPRAYGNTWSMPNQMQMRPMPRAPLPYQNRW